LCPAFEGRDRPQNRIKSRAQEADIVALDIDIAVAIAIAIDIAIAIAA